MIFWLWGRKSFEKWASGKNDTEAMNDVSVSRIAYSTKDVSIYSCLEFNISHHAFWQKYTWSNRCYWNHRGQNLLTVFHRFLWHWGWLRCHADPMDYFWRQINLHQMSFPRNFRDGNSPLWDNYVPQMIWISVPKAFIYITKAEFLAISPYYSNVIMARWHLKSPASRWFAQTFVQARIKENIKASR